MLSPNTILRERYRIVHQLGHGGMGAVYQAMDENLSCVVAVKETFAATDEQRRAFRREAELLANLSHPTLPRVMDHFTHDDGQFLVMQFVPGHDLAELLELREQPFSVAKVLEWADQLLDALEDLHSSSPPIIHRDIKPSNLKVTPKGRILLLDFGLAKGVAGQMSTADVDSHGKSIYGYTPNYAPIEQIRAAGTDARSDLYSLAATMWTLLTGEVPPDALSRLAEKDDGNPDPLRPAHEINPQVPTAVSGALNHALAVNRNHRPVSAAEFRKALREAREEFEHPTTAQEATTLRAPRAPKPPPLGSTIKVQEGEISGPVPSGQHQPTMRVDSPPPVPSFDRPISSATANSFVVEDAARSKSGRLIVLIGAGALVVALALGVLVWQPWAKKNETVQTTPNATQSTGAATTNSTAPTGMVYVPGGTFMMGSDKGVDEAERPAHQVTVKPFFIDTYEVTNEDYEKFVKAANYHSPATWKNGSFPSGAERKPVTGVMWYDANEYARWAGKRLPTEEEWEFAARGTDGRTYPWGNDWRQGSANANGAEQSMVDVGAHNGASPFGAYDMIGNAWEWTASNFRAYPGGRLPANQPSGELKAIRGGSYESTKDYGTTTYRVGWPSRYVSASSQTGFRCVKDVQ